MLLFLQILYKLIYLFFISFPDLFFYQKVHILVLFSQRRKSVIKLISFLVNFPLFLTEIFNISIISIKCSNLLVFYLLNLGKISIDFFISRFLVIFTYIIYFISYSVFQSFPKCINCYTQPFN